MNEQLYWTLAQMPGRGGGDMLAGAFGVVAALLLVGGPLFLRYQRNRQRFELLKASIEQGLPPMPDGTPLWLRSLREGLTTLTLGLGLLVVGGVMYVLCAHVPAPSRNSTSSQDLRGSALHREPATQPSTGRIQPPPFPGGRGPGQGFGDGMGPPGRPPDDRPPQDRPPQDRQARGEQDAQHPPQPRPRDFDPADEAWHRAQDAMALAVVAMGSGFVLALLGLVRIVFSRVEAKYGDAAKSHGP